MALLAYVALEGENKVLLILIHSSLLLLSMLVLVLNYGISLGYVIQLTPLFHSNHSDHSLLFKDIFYAGNYVY